MFIFYNTQLRPCTSYGEFVKEKKIIIQNVKEDKVQKINI